MRTSLVALFSLASLAISAPPPAQLAFGTDSLVTGYSSLTSLLTSSRQSSLYYDYFRTAAPASLHAQLSAPPPAHTTLLVPTNQAILALQRKPHQGPPGPVVVDVPEGMFKITMIDAREEEEAREAYLVKWIERHAIAGKVDLDGEGWQGKRFSAMDGAQVWFELADDGETRVLQPGGIEVVGVESVSEQRLALSHCGTIFQTER